MNRSLPLGCGAPPANAGQFPLIPVDEPSPAFSGVFTGRYHFLPQGGREDLWLPALPSLSHGLGPQGQLRLPKAALASHGLTHRPFCVVFFVVVPGGRVNAVCFPKKQTWGRSDTEVLTLVLPLCTSSLLCFCGNWRLRSVLWTRGRGPSLHPASCSPAIGHQIVQEGMENLNSSFVTFSLFQA